jgi:hypothetical protein
MTGNRWSNHRRIARSFQEYDLAAVAGRGSHRLASGELAAGFHHDSRDPHGALDQQYGQ